MNALPIIGIFLALGAVDNWYITAVGVALVALALPKLREG